MKKKVSGNLQKKSRRTQKSSLRLKLVPMDLNDFKELDWLYHFVHRFHSAPDYIMPSLEDLRSSSRKFFRATIVSPKKDAGKTLGVTGYEIRTPYLAESQKTIIDQKFRGQGWGKVISRAVEEVVRKAGYKKIRSCIYTSNRKMIQIKLEQGYTIEGYHPDHDGPGLHEYSLGKML